KTAFIGGNVATNASGGRGFKYGNTRDYVRRLKVILSTGEILDIKRGEIFANGSFDMELVGRGRVVFPIPKYIMPNVKNAAGYYSKNGMDLIDLFIGQEGTLGVVTEIEVRLLPKRGDTFDCITFFSHDSDAINFANEARRISLEARAKDIEAASLEYADVGALALLREKYTNIPKGACSAIFFSQETTEKTEDPLIDSWSKLLEKHNAILDNVWFATDEKKKKEFHDLRHSIPESVNEIVKRTGFPKTGTDLAVPLERFSEMMRSYREKLDPSGIHYVIFGHIGECHMHVNMLPKSAEENEKAKSIYIELVKKALSLGGTVSAEHGIGKLKHKYLEMMYGRSGLIEMAALKKVLDPKCILGLGNIFPGELL
ncbi:MAG: FAD-binding oxidoreductase, partial [Candidatus Saganbacteria bacterium]|nr:FAD-binding oxidoreductase [Candidatus Saganbacteria bacterium]